MNDRRRQQFNTRIIRFFGDQLAVYGPDSPGALAWTSKDTQFTRFSILTQVGNLQDHSLLDVGSGLGDLYGFLLENNINNVYTGIELSPDHYRHSLQKYPGINVIHADFIDYSFKQIFDYVLCSGTFNALYPDHRRYLQTAVKKMFSLARTGIAFNLLNNAKEPSNIDKDPQDIELAYVDPAFILSFIRSLTDRFVIRHDYLDNDFTVYLYR
ncbi:MAG TPA: methyltransferase [Patescibacteria group bacterium]